jgi:hypothetical protein
VPSTAEKVSPASCHKNRCFLIRGVYSNKEKYMYIMEKKSGKKAQKNFFKNFKFFLKK